jgi:hypothetical protein
LESEFAVRIGGIYDGLSERQGQLKVLRDDLLSLVMEESAKHRINHGGWDPSCRNPVGFTGQVDFDKRLSECSQMGAAESNA